MRHQRISQEGLYSCRCSTTSPEDQETLKKSACEMSISFLFVQKDLEQDNGHLLVLVLKRSGILSVKIVHKENGQYGGNDDVGISQKTDIQFSVLQVHCPEVGSKAKAVENCHESFHDRTGQPVVGVKSSSSFVPSVIKTEVPLDCDYLAHKDLLLQQYGERIEKLSQQYKLSKIC